MRTAERITAFSKLVKLLDDALTSVSDFRKVMPPIEWRAAHREMARAATEQLRSQIQITLTVIAPDAAAAGPSSSRLIPDAAPHRFRTQSSRERC